MTLVSTGAQALTHTGDASAHFTLSSTNGNTIVESVVFDGSQMAGNTRKISTVSAGTASLTVAESGGVVILDRVGGSTISLPDIDSANIGTIYTFTIATASTSVIRSRRLDQMTHFWED